MPRTGHERLRILAEGKFTRLVAAGHWEWVERINVSGAVVISPITEDRRLVLIRQYRIPLAAAVLEFRPASPATRPTPPARNSSRPPGENCSKKPATRRAAGNGSWTAQFPWTDRRELSSLSCDRLSADCPGRRQRARKDRGLDRPLEGIDAWLEVKRPQRAS